MDDWHEGAILLDVPSGAAGEFDRTALERMGHPVRVCHGPPAGTVCPLLRGDGCSFFEHAHGVVFKLDLGVAQHRAILRRYRQVGAGDLPIRVLVSAADTERYADLLADVEVWRREPSVADLDGFACEVEAADRLAQLPADPSPRPAS
jgi:hypothetical protein